jgi:hypothetical protein
MRLIHTSDLTFREFGDHDIEPYAILSHCWSQDPNEPEITYQQMVSGDFSRDGQGWQKIEKCCEKARNRNIDWAWVDTCCIDKTASAELSEIINSMFRWYERAERCFAFARFSWPFGT